MEAGPAELRLREMRVGYRRGTPVLGGLSLDVVPGEALAVVGPNGSGKTTLFRTLLGVLPSLGGTAQLSGSGPAECRQRHGVRLWTAIAWFGLGRIQRRPLAL